MTDLLDPHRAKRRPVRGPVWLCMGMLSLALGGVAYRLYVAERAILNAHGVIVTHHQDIIALGSHVKCREVKGERICPGHKYIEVTPSPIPSATPTTTAKPKKRRRKN